MQKGLLSISELDKPGESGKMLTRDCGFWPWGAPNISKPIQITTTYEKEIHFTISLLRCPSRNWASYSPSRRLSGVG
jgi:hypothetical protein